ncbi:response regulator transcription factor [Aquabacter spiritensis]|uniref:Response regulator receiver domain-containing protein n=1 Tax=Aquabacter spiritensis TaxID=933073 RepID=A0A4R3LN23_9HYPH|nr:response regulator [Aquabacter spiritensis]TCT01722.1 response regulator receiver domain-containing protein [Aquabacter spiritensis]
MSCTVLIVDDSKLARMSVAKSLRSLHPDWTHLEAANADDALAQVRKHKVDLALLDFNMPGRDGLTLAAELKAIDPSLPLAVVSANHQEEIIRKAQEIGAVFLAKPLTEKVLAEYLSGAASRRNAAAKE